jgi:NAD(P)-dependent dehydrogenase (short-subunit alcohol dehydrogenase family)
MKTILITGAGSGIGRALAEVFSRNDWTVIAACRNEKDLAATPLNESSRVLSVDVSEQQSLDRAFLALKDAPIDVLINCAGVFDSVRNSVDDDTVFSTVPDVSKVFQVNTIAPRLIAEGLIHNLQKGGEKLVVTISSIMGTYPAMDEYHAMHWPYSASKAAVTYAMIAFATQYPDIKSTLIHPGWVKTKMGGMDAPLEPSAVAEKIFTLIADHADKLPNGKLVDTEGQVMDL